MKDEVIKRARARNFKKLVNSQKVTISKAEYDDLMMKAKVLARRYYLMTIGDKERAIKAIAGLLELGAPINTQGPETEATSKPEEGAAPTETAPEATATPSQAEEEKTES